MNIMICFINSDSRSQRPSGLKRVYTADRLLGLRVRIPPGEWMSVVSVVLSCRGLCDGSIRRPEEFYRLCCVIVCQIENLKNEAG